MNKLLKLMKEVVDIWFYFALRLVVILSLIAVWLFILVLIFTYGLSI